MKLKTAKTTLTIETINHADGKLNIDFTDERTCEELQEIFSDKEIYICIECLHQSDDELTSVIPGYVVLDADHFTVTGKQSYWERKRTMQRKESQQYQKAWLKM